MYGVAFLVSNAYLCIRKKYIGTLKVIKSQDNNTWRGQSVTPVLVKVDKIKMMMPCIGRGRRMEA